MCAYGFGHVCVCVCHVRHKQMMVFLFFYVCTNTNGYTMESELINKELVTPFFICNGLFAGDSGFPVPFITLANLTNVFF